MLERNISNHKLGRETTISRQAISKIKNHEFHDISVNVLTEMLEYFNAWISIPKDILKGFLSQGTCELILVYID